MSFVTVLLVACVVSFLGSIPPGTINISVMQLAMLHRRSAALAFGLAASLVEFVYAGLTVRFHIFLTENTNITDNFQIITAIAMIILGIANMRSHKKTEDVHTPYEKGLRRHAFRKGLLLGVMNPMTVPFWLAVTAYLETNSWVELNSDNFYGYITGFKIIGYSRLSDCMTFFMSETEVPLSKLFHFGKYSSGMISNISDLLSPSMPP